MDRRRTRRLGFMGPRALLGLVMVLGTLGLQAGGGTLAYFTSTATSTANTFTTGTVTLKLTDANETAQSAITGSISPSTFAKPGDTAVGYVTVNNAGTLPYDYGLKYTATNTTGTLWGVGSPPTLQVYRATAVGDCTHANVTGAKTGLTSVYGATAVSTTADTVVFDSGAASKRPVAAGASEVLCLAVTWPNGAAGVENPQMGATGNVDFTFDAR